MANTRKVTFMETTHAMINGTTMHSYKVVSLTNVISLHIGDVLTEKEVKSMINARTRDVVIRG